MGARETLLKEQSKESIGVAGFGRGVGFVGGTGGMVAGAALALALSGCAKPAVSDLDAYQVVPMDRVVPYPSEAELGKRVFEVVVVDRPADGLDEQMLVKPRSQVRVGLEKIAASYGAAVADRSKPGDGVRTDRPLSEFHGVDAAVVPGRDFTISTRFTTYRHEAVWIKPMKLPWQSEADLAEKPGTCTHTAEVAFDVLLVEKGWEDTIRQTYLLSHKAIQQNKDLDQACTIAPVNVETLFETAIAEALGCLELPLGNRVSPRGHVLAHRKAREGESHIYRISLGADQGIDAGEPVEFRRVEVSKAPDGNEQRNERVIATGPATDQISAQDSWIAVAVDDVKSPILEGDVVRRYFQNDLITNLSGPNCKLILVER